MTAIVTCGYSRPSLAATRALSRGGVVTVVGAPKIPSLASCSRYAASSFLTHDPKEAASSFVEHLAREMRGRYATCVLPSSDQAWWALSRFRELLPPESQRLMPPHYSVARALDLEALQQFAETLGIPTTAPRNHGEQAAISVTTAAKRRVSYFGFIDKGVMVGEGFQEQFLDIEPSNEMSIVAMTIAPIKSIRKHSQTLLSALLWQGPFKIDFVKEPGRGFCLVGLVGRLWGSLSLAIRSGVNVPLLYHQATLGTLNTTPILAMPDVRMLSLASLAIAPWQNGRQMLKRFSPTNIKKNATKLVKGIVQKQKVSNCFDVFDMDDPLPLFYELLW
jgi:hypothetical protein